MNREIKFRAWDKEEKKICQDFLFFMESAILQNWGNPWNDPRFIPLQFTGLHDKNGVEIYEGDIVCLIEDVVVENIGGYNRTELEGKIREVVWKDAAWFVGDEMIWEWDSDCEVIGNKYSNPELLK